LSEAQWNWKPGQDRWSIGETAEHILLAAANDLQVHRFCSEDPLEQS
jgi:hypothetical protein